jgi:sugar phosphate isomerase/epimerase
VIPHRSSRRDFLRSSAVAAVTVASATSLRAVEPFARTGPARLRLALAAYSFRDEFGKGKDGSGPKTDMFRFLDYCAEQGCDGAELTSYYFPEGADADYFRQVRRHAFLRGVSISGTAVGNTFTLPEGPKRDQEIAHVKEWIAKAAILGAPHIRVFAGDAKGRPLAEAQRDCIAALEDCGAEAARHGIFLGIENHGGIVAEADSLLKIVQAVKNPWVGINLDTGNFHTADPYSDLERCAPYAVNVQFKGYLQPRGQKKGLADVARTFEILKRARYQGWVALEYEFPEDPHVRVPAMLREMRPHLG